MTDSGNDDVRELLGRAFGQEPPLRIDREEVLQQGRKRLRRKRVFEASSVVAAVVVAAVGAATLTNLADSGPERMPPAATTTTQAPSDPELPLSPPSTTTTTTSRGAPSVNTSNSKGPAPSMDRALQLTQSLYDSAVLPLTKVRPVPDGPQDSDGRPSFRVAGNVYLYEADVHNSKWAGFVQIAVDYAPGEVANCDTIPAVYVECSTKQFGSRPMVVARWEGDDGERQFIAFAMMADGTRVAALATNTTKAEQRNGVSPDATRQPVLDGDDLCSLIGKSGLSVH
jgi:hypothetical protein